VSAEVIPAGPDHADLFAALHAACFAAAWDAASFRTFLGQPGVIGLLASENGKPEGFMLGRCAAGEAEILTIGVLPARRRHGLGGVLLDALVAVLPGDVTALFLEVADGNSAAIALYRSRGFHPVARRSRYYADGADALLLRRAF
jgi:ribosomal-protein-alanine N-acetyltransferase